MRSCKELGEGKEKGNMYGGWLKEEDQLIYKPLWQDECSEKFHLVASLITNPTGRVKFTEKSKVIQSSVAEAGETVSMFEPMEDETVIWSHPKPLTNNGICQLSSWNLVNMSVEANFEYQPMDVQNQKKAKNKRPILEDPTKEIHGPNLK